MEPITIAVASIDPRPRFSRVPVLSSVMRSEAIRGGKHFSRHPIFAVMPARYCAVRSDSVGST
jgi:hypothetical protein